MERLKHRLNSWQQQGFLTAEQSNKILAYESAKPKVNWMLYSFIILGIAVIGIGIIAIIAANWANIADSVKLSVDFILLFLLALAVFLTDKDKYLLLQDAFIFLFMLLCLASIGLISQIYHTGGELYQAILFWSIITLILAVISKQLFIPFFWTLIVIINTIYWLTTLPIFSGGWHNVNWLVPIIAAPYCLAILSNFFLKFKFSFSISVAFRFWILWMGLFALAISDFVLSGQWFTSYSPHYDLYSYLYFLIPLLIVEIYSLFSKDYNKAQKILLTTISLLFLVMILAILFIDKSKLISAILVILILFAAAMYFGIRNDKKAFTFLTLLIALRFVIVYFTVFGSLASTGFGLIISGLVIIIVAILWAKNVNKLQRLIGELVNDNP